MALGTDAVRSQLRLTVPEDLKDLYGQLAAYIEREQNGGINQLGLKIQLRASVPIDAPGANQPNFVIIENPSGLGPQPYVYVLGIGWRSTSSTGLPSAHVLATTGGLGPEHTVSGLTAGQVVRATSATTAAFQQLNFTDLTGSLAYAQLPTGSSGSWDAGVGNVVTITRDFTVSGLLTGSTGARLATSSGVVMLGTTTPSTNDPILDIVQPNIPQMVLATATADATAKAGYLAVRCYTNAEEPVQIFGILSAAIINVLQFGGGAGTLNAATFIQFYTATGVNTLTGTLRWQIDPNGHLTAGTDNTQDFGAAAATRPRTGYFGTSVVIGTDPTGAQALRVGGALKISSATMIATATNFTNGAGAGAGTITNAPSAGNPTKWIPVDDNGTTRYLPAW